MNKGVKMLTPECTALTDRKIFGDFEKKVKMFCPCCYREREDILDDDQMEDHLISKDGDGHGVRIKFAAFALLIKNEEDMKRLHSILISGFSEPSGPMHTGGDTHGYQRHRDTLSRKWEYHQNSKVFLKNVIEIITLEDEMEPDHQDILNRCPYVNKLFGPYIQEVEKDHKSTPTAKASFVAKLMKYKNVYKDLYCSNPPPQKTEVTGVSLDPEGKLQLHWSGKVLVKGEKLEKGVHEEAEREHGIKSEAQGKSEKLKKSVEFNVPEQLATSKDKPTPTKSTTAKLRPEKRAQKRRGDDDEEDLTSYTPFEDPAGHKRYIGNNDDDDDEREFKEAAPKPKKAKKTSTDKGVEETEVKLVKKGRLPASSEEEEEVQTAKAVTQEQGKKATVSKSVAPEGPTSKLIGPKKVVIEEVQQSKSAGKKKWKLKRLCFRVLKAKRTKAVSEQSIIFVEESSPSTIEEQQEDTIPLAVVVEDVIKKKATAPKKRGEEKITQGDRVEEETGERPKKKLKEGLIQTPPILLKRKRKGKGKVVKGRGKSQKDKDYDFPQFVTAKSPLNTLKAIGERLSLKGNEYRTGTSALDGHSAILQNCEPSRRTPALPTEIPVEKLGIFRSLIEE
ncbi:hypothetical protein BC829DRAFT_419351 [Chytridium lagenaria]|nr:hypothetical protein BC829DRAFT_419351 [Chytridium lagenaria]